MLAPVAIPNSAVYVFSERVEFPFYTPVEKPFVFNFGDSQQKLTRGARPRFMPLTNCSCAVRYSALSLKKHGDYSKKVEQMASCNHDFRLFDSVCQFSRGGAVSPGRK